MGRHIWQSHGVSGSGFMEEETCNISSKGLDSIARSTAFQISDEKADLSVSWVGCSGLDRFLPTGSVGFRSGGSPATWRMSKVS